MLTIRELLERHAPGRFFDKGLPWGAKASDYRAEIEECLAQGLTPVLVELQEDFEIDGNKIVVADHHNERAGAGRPTSLHQVFDLLGLGAEEWTWWHELVAANDRGYIREMKEVGATQEEIREVRAADRQTQGVTAEEEREAEEAINDAEVLFDGRLTVVRLPHGRTSPVADRMERDLGGEGYENLLALSPGQVNFFGDGSVIRALDEKFQGGWYGGSLPERGFWGGHFESKDVLDYLSNLLS
jgi:hypothetical protein